MQALFMDLTLYLGEDTPRIHERFLQRHFNHLHAPETLAAFASDGHREDDACAYRISASDNRFSISKLLAFSPWFCALNFSRFFSVSQRPCKYAQ